MTMMMMILGQSDEAPRVKHRRRQESRRKRRQGDGNMEVSPPRPTIEEAI